MSDRVIQIGGYITRQSRDNPYNGRIYSKKGLSPTLTQTMGTAGNCVPVIIEEYEAL